MFEFALLIGAYSYIILLLGLIGFLSKTAILVATVPLLPVIIIQLRRKKYVGSLKGKSLLFYCLLPCFILLSLVNLLGALGPELAFDALWYHLTLPKLYLLKESFYFVPGGTLYYATMPQLTEMLYLAGIALHSEIFAKLIHFSFGLGICWSIYKIAKHYVGSGLSLLAAVIFYSNLVVAWESITAYIELARTFFELIAFWGIVKWVEDKQNKWLVLSGLVIGLAISTKFLSLGTLGILLILMFFYLVKLRQTPQKILKTLTGYFILAVAVPLPWFIHSFLNRGNPFYPMFSGDLQSDTQFPGLNPLVVVGEFWQVFTNAADPISPVYIVFLPLVIAAFRKIKSKEKIFLYFSVLALVLWYFTPRTGGGRFLLPFLPVLSILVVLVINIFKTQKALFNLSIAFIVFISVTTIFFRGAANYRYLNYVLGKESKEEFLKNNLEFEYGNFADIDGYFRQNIKLTDKVLLYGFHNLYYVDFPFIDSSWVQKGDKFNYIAVKEGELPELFKDWKEIYSNEITKVRLYSNGGNFWVY